jgi:hypothetical protein
MLIGISGNCTTRADAFYRSVMIPASHELAAVQPTCRQPHADAVVHEHLHAVGAAVGEQVGMVRARRTEDVTPRDSAASVPARMFSGCTASQTVSTLINAAARASSRRSRPMPTTAR